jgi:hypothetical protein
MSSRDPAIGGASAGGAAFLAGARGSSRSAGGASAARLTCLAVDADLSALISPRWLRRAPARGDDHLIRPLAMQRFGDFVFARFRRVVFDVDGSLDPIRFAFHLALSRR